MTKKLWTRPQPLPGLKEENYSISQRLGISTVVADILRQRGVETEEQILEFLRPSLLNLHSPFAFREMAQALKRLESARRGEEKVLIYGDYDVDGVTSTTLLYKVLTNCGLKAVAYIPSRMDEGYGLHKEAILKASQANVKVIITVDCGITAVEEVEYAKTLGIDIILTDHHEPPAILPQAYAILNPKIPDSGYPFRDLAGVGVAFKLAQALLETLDQGETGEYAILEVMDLVALGTIADLVPLVGENRIIVASGLRQMEHTIHLGLQTLLEECGLWNKPLKAGQIAFMVAPRINAAGRMDSARAGLELLLTGHEERAKELAKFLSRENSLRQDTEKEIVAEAVEILEKSPIPRVIVLSAENWHHGVIGIVASRIVERYYRPVFIISEEEELSKGSARGIGGYHVLNELREQDQLLEKFGGHCQAAGFSLKKENIPLLREALNRSAEKLPEELFYERLRVDQYIPLESIDASLMRELEHLAPFGFGNPNPVLAGEDYTLYQADTVGKDQAHLKCSFGPRGEWEGIAFRKGEEIEKIINSPTVDVAFGLEWNTFRGVQCIQLMIKDILPKATWLENDEQQRALQEIAVGSAENPEERALAQDLEVMDWREKNREEWMQALEDWGKLVNLWDCTGTTPEWRGLNPEAQWMMILGVPSSWQEVYECISQSRGQGIGGFVFAQSRVDDDLLKRRTDYLSRENLVQIYRVLYDLAIKKNPFSWQMQDLPLWQARVALRIFEELGLLRCLRYTDQKADLEWIPATQKLDLESSLRFRTAKRRWEDVKAFGEDYRTLPWTEFKQRLDKGQNKLG
ncbi:single-stranded-DNA-specific exonuclease RecJ [Desulfitobacterium dichloroeliminans LMG P-21439]|uniref:Single-stranded-DNA-specific exonuclease RecJ n=1 Tax=Desulfitobacterium dichloroeliminans (strain LMG P-21439 / DCA1) TaxID=871963 RepID=L0F7X2_DESDL|nr:single-stranded-DNA-specific exonuclease RecJ [Desulfitobacterium dichloroeliminans]AGA69934.1 single-stranded-DNA-specific exonuclease RecJ [Desulfitobacterium dichloroeliminans LMG P-21439]